MVERAGGGSDEARVLAEERLRLALEAGGLGMFDWDPATGGLVWDERTRAIFGVGAGFAPSYESAMALIHRDDRARVEAAQRSALADRGRLDLRFRIVRPDGAVRLVQVHSRHFAAPGSAGRIIGIHRDVTDEAARDDERRAREGRYRRLFDANLIGVAFAELDGRVTEANDAFLAILGFSREDVAAGLLNWHRATAPASIAADERAADELRRSGVARVYEKEYLRKDGVRAPVLVGRMLLEGEPRRTVAFVLDLAERKRAEADRERLVGELEAALSARDDFLSVASHELKTPLSALRLRCQLAMRVARRMTAAGGATPEAAAEELRLLEGAERQLDRVLGLINGLLDVSRLQAGRLELDREEVDLAAVARAVLEQFEDEAARAGCPLVLRAPAPVVGRWDRLRLEEVATNLVSNALKYGCGGGQPIEVAVEASAGGARLSVRDRGPGIPPEARERVFERFERAGAERGPRSGFGLGLWIARQIVEAHGGSIRAATPEGGGAELVVELPRE